MTPSRSALLVVLLALGACEKKKEPDAPTVLPPASTRGADAPAGTASGAGPAEATSGPGAVSGAGPADGSKGRAAQPLDVKVPEALPLDATSARALLLAPLAESTVDFELAGAALDYLVRLGDTDAAQEHAGKLLAKGADTGGYEDVDLAAVGLLALVRTGDGNAVQRTLALAKAIAGDGSSTAPEPLVRALEAIDGAQAADARRLLADFAKDDAVRGEAFSALAAKRANEGIDFAATVANDAEDEPATRGAALANLLAVGDARAEGAGQALVASVIDEALGSEAIDGLAGPGLVESLPMIQKIVAGAVAEDAAAIEIRSAAQAFVTIRGAGKGTEADLAYLRSLLGKDDGDADGEVRAALWILGDDKEAVGAAKRLAEIVNGTDAGIDEDPGVDVLEALGLRAAGAKPPFARLVNAAAAVKPRKDPKSGGIAQDFGKLRLAAAYAFLASQR